MLNSPNLVAVRRGEINCSFITIPNGLKQHAIPEGVIHFALAKCLIEKLPDPSIICGIRYMI